MILSYVLTGTLQFDCRTSTTAAMNFAKIGIYRRVGHSSVFASKRPLSKLQVHERSHTCQEFADSDPCRTTIMSEHRKRVLEARKIQRDAELRLPAPTRRKPSVKMLAAERLSLLAKIKKYQNEGRADPVLAGILAKYRTNEGVGVLGHVKDDAEDVMGSLAETMTAKQKMHTLKWVHLCERVHLCLCVCVRVCRNAHCQVKGFVWKVWCGEMVCVSE